MENPLLELQEYENLQEALKKAKGPVQATGTLDSQKVHLMYWLGKDGGFPWKLVELMMTREPGRSTMIFAALRKTYGFTRQRICCFTVRISTET